MLIRLCDHEIRSWSFFPSCLAVLTDNFGLNCCFLQKERASHSGHYQAFCMVLIMVLDMCIERVPDKCSASLPLAFAKMTVCTLGWRLSHCPMSPAARTACLQRASWQGCKFCVSGLCGINQCLLLQTLSCVLLQHDVVKACLWWAAWFQKGKGAMQKPIAAVSAVWLVWHRWNVHSTVEQGILWLGVCLGKTPSSL